MMLKKQIFVPRDVQAQDVIRISQMGLQYSEGLEHGERGWRWCRQQVCCGDTFSLMVLEGFYAGGNRIAYTNQEDYIKINFWLSGKRTTVLNGFGQHEHEGPEVFITCGPPDMIKMDVLNWHTQVAQVCLCVRRAFFPLHLGLSPDRLPEPLRSLTLAEEKPYAFHAFTLTPSAVAATRAILAAPFSVRREPVYARAKAIELMCLLIDQLTSAAAKSDDTGEIGGRRKLRLYEARELLGRHYAKAVTLEAICREVGLSRAALTSGFRRLFGMSVYDYLQKERMERAYQLLQDKTYTIGQVAEAVGYAHSCNFSTAFRAFYGCAPQKLRTGRS